MKKGQPAGRQGFTIVEMVVYMGLLTVMLVLLTRMFTGILDMQLTSTAVGEVEQDSRYIFARLAYDIGRASSVAGAGSSLILFIDGIANTYSLNNNNVVLENAVGADTLNSGGTQISNLSFLQLGNSIQIKFTITSTTQNVQGPDAKDMQTSIALR